MGDWSLLRLTFAAALSCAFALASARGEANPISVEYLGGDRIGTFLAHEVTEEIAGSAALSVGQADEDGWKLVLLTTESGRVAFYSVILVRKRFAEVFDQYVVAFNGFCSATRLRYCAREIVGRVKDPIDQFERNWRELTLPENTAAPEEASEKAG